jgi:hypothetical protein
MFVFGDELCHMLAAAASEDKQIYQGIGAQAVGSMYGDAGYLTGGVETGERCPLRVDDDPGIEIGWDATHGIVRSWLDGYRLSNRLYTEVVAREIGDVGQFLLDDLSAQVTYVQEDVVFAVDAAPLLDFLDNAA